SIKRPNDVGNGHSVGKAPKRIGPLAACRVALLGVLHTPEIVLEDLPQRSVEVIQVKTILVTRDRLWVPPIEAAEVKKGKRKLTNIGRALPQVETRSCLEVPIGHVVARMLQNQHSIEERRSEIHPLLVG